MSAPPRKSRRISKRKEVIQDNDNSDTHTNVIGNTENRATAQMIKTQIEVVIPDTTKSVIAALSAHGLLFPGNNMVNVTQTTNTDNIVTCTSSGLNSNALSTSVRNEDNSNETSQSVNISNNNNASTDTSSLENNTTSKH
jgi:hypothetical protein